MRGPHSPPSPHEISYPTLSADTDPRAEAVQIDILRRMPAWKKVRLVEGAIRSSRALALAGLRRRHPEASPEQLRRLLMGLLLGEELATRVYGPGPEAGDPAR